MPNSSDGETGDALLGALITILSVFIVALLALVCYLYYQLRQIHQQYEALLRESSATLALSQRIHEQRKSAIEHMAIDDDLEQQRFQDANSTKSQHSGCSSDFPDGWEGGIFYQDIPCVKPGSPETEPWAVRKVRSMERLTSLTNELSIKPVNLDPHREPVTRRKNQNPFPDLVKSNYKAELSRGRISGKEQALNEPPAHLKSTSLETESETILQQTPQKTSSPETTLLIVPVAKPLTECQSPRMLTRNASSQPDSIKPESKSIIPPHARSSPPQFPIRDPAYIVDEIYLTKPANPKDVDAPGNYNTDDVPRPFIDRSFSLTLAFSNHNAGPSINYQNSRGIKIKNYLRIARNNRRSLLVAAGRLSRRYTAVTAPKSKRRLIRLPKINHHGSSSYLTEGRIMQDKLAKIGDFNKDI